MSPPIKPEHRHHYRTPEWKAASKAVRERAGGRCERCGVANGAEGYREPRRVIDNLQGQPGRFVEVHGDGQASEAMADGRRLIRIVLTVAHLDGDGHLGRHDPARMQHLCQACHNGLDASARAVNAARTRAAKRADAAQQSVPFHAEPQEGRPS